MQRHHADVIELRAAEPSCTVALFRLNRVLAFLSPNCILRAEGRGFAVHGTKTQECFPSSHVMTDDKLTPPGSSPQNLGQSELEIVVRGDTKSDHAYDSLDPTYIAKAKILNNALREIGMGKYQVWSTYYELRSPCQCAT
jgi:hypothetical protein